MQRAAIIAHSHGNASWPTSSPAVSLQLSGSSGSQEGECSSSRRSPPGQRLVPSSTGGIQPDAGGRQSDSRSSGCREGSQAASELQPMECLGGGTPMPNGVTDCMAAAGAAKSLAGVAADAAGKGCAALPEAGAEGLTDAAGERSVPAGAQSEAEVGQPETLGASADRVPQPEHMDSPVMNLDAACSGPG